MVDGAPKVAELAVDLHERLIQMPTPLDEAPRERDASLARRTLGQTDSTGTRLSRD
jgi:hypothetical protein